MIFRGTIQVTTSNLLRPGNLILDLVDAKETLAGQALRSSIGVPPCCLHAELHPVPTCIAHVRHCLIWRAGRAEQFGPCFQALGPVYADVSRECHAASSVIPVPKGQQGTAGALILALPTQASPTVLRWAALAGPQWARTPLEVSPDVVPATLHWLMLQRLPISSSAGMLPLGLQAAGDVLGTCRGAEDVHNMQAPGAEAGHAGKGHGGQLWGGAAGDSADCGAVPASAHAPDLPARPLSLLRGQRPFPAGGFYSSLPGAKSHVSCGVCHKYLTHPCCGRVPRCLPANQCTVVCWMRVSEMLDA